MTGSTRDRERLHESPRGASVPRAAPAPAIAYAARCAATLIALVTVVGCGERLPDTIRVRGRVTYQGKPLSEGTIAFHPAGPPGRQLYRPAVGVLAEDGTYQLQSFRHGDGIMPGEYAVVIESYASRPTAEDSDRPLKWWIPQKYGNPATSGLTATIPADAAGGLQFEFDLP